MISSIKRLYAEDLSEGDELDLDGDEYGDNENAVYGFAVVEDREDFYQNGESWVRLTTSQGTFPVPAGHLMRVKLND